MKPIGLIRASVGLAATELLRDLGAPADRLWERNLLPPLPLLGPEDLVPFHLLARFLDDAAASQGIDDFGIELVRRAGFRAAGSFGAAIVRAPTLHAALETARYAVPGHNSAAQYWTILEGDSVRLCRRFRGEGGFRQADLLTVTLMAHLVRLVAGPQWRPARIELQSAGPAPADPVGLLSAAEIESSRPATSITFPRALLARALPAPATVPPPLAREDWLATAPPADFLASLEVVIGSQLAAGRLDVHAAAAAAGSSVRSLQRRLMELRVSYSEVVERVRFRIASELLHDERVKIIEIAFAAGYSDPAHFTRAFRRWTSLTPHEYRRSLLAGEGAQRSA
jgi:AraC-like DNA-binding protein